MTTSVINEDMMMMTKV